MFYKKGVLKNFTKFTGKHPWQRLFFDKVAGLRPATSFKKTLWHRCFPVNFPKFVRTKFILFFFVATFFATFLNFFATIISDLDFDFEHVLKLLHLLYFHPRTQALSKLSEIVDDMKLDFSSETNSSSENTYSPSEENFDNVTFYRW